jgi:hypothetical protein
MATAGGDVERPMTQTLKHIGAPPPPPRRSLGRRLLNWLTWRPWLVPAVLAVVVVIAATSVAAGWPHKRGTSAIPAAETNVTDELSAFFGPTLEPRKGGGSFGLNRIDIQRSTGTPFGYFARVTYPAYSSSTRASKTSDGITVGGTQLYLQTVAAPTDHAFLRYYLRIPNGFDWVKGGKLPGLYGGTVTSGRKIPNGVNGLSTRYMWRAGGAAEVYAYLPTSKEHGTSLGRGDWHWPTGSWTCVEQEVSLNQPGRSDGSVNVWLNGKQVLAQRDLTFRTSDNLEIGGLFFSTFFGGGDKTWATPTSQSIDFADFAISDRREGC